MVRELGKIVGRDNVLHHPEDLLVYEYDGSIDRSTPQVVVLPANTEEVSRVVAVGYRHGIPIVGRGSGTGLSGGAIAVMGGIQIALARMNRILEVNREDRLAMVQPAVINLNLDNRVRQSGMRYAPDPSSQRACSIGGNVAENAGGPHCLAYGVTTNHVLGLEVVLEDGSIVRLGSRNREAPGYDLRGAFVGSEGTFGIATTATVRLLPAPPAVKTFQGVFADVPSACNAVSAIIGRGIVPAAMEMVDALTIKAVQSVMDAGYPDDAGAVLLIEVEGTPDEVEELEAEVRPALRDAHSADVRTATDAADRERLWSGRKGALGALGSLGAQLLLGGWGSAPHPTSPWCWRRWRKSRSTTVSPSPTSSTLAMATCTPASCSTSAGRGSWSASPRREASFSEDMRRGWRYPERRARHRLGEESLHALGVHRR